MEVELKGDEGAGDTKTLEGKLEDIYGSKVKREDEVQGHALGVVRVPEDQLGKVLFLNLADKEFYMSGEDNALVFCLDDKNREGSVTLQFEYSLTVLFHARFTCKGESFKPSIFPIQNIQKGSPIRLLIEKPEELVGRGRGSTQTLTLVVYVIDATGSCKREVLSAEFHLRILKTVKQNYSKFSKAKPFERTLSYSGDWADLTEEEKGGVEIAPIPIPISIPPAGSNGSGSTTVTRPASLKRTRESMESEAQPKRRRSSKRPRIDAAEYNRELDQQILEWTSKCNRMSAVVQHVRKALDVVRDARSHFSASPMSASNPQLIQLLAADDGGIILNPLQPLQGQEVAVSDPTTKSTFSFRINTDKEVPQQ